MRHHKNTPKVWVCPYPKCNKSYSLKSNMLQHAKAKHPSFQLPGYAQDAQRRSLPIPKPNLPSGPALTNTASPHRPPQEQGLSSPMNQMLSNAFSVPPVTPQIGIKPDPQGLQPMSPAIPPMASFQALMYQNMQQQLLMHQMMQAAQFQAQAQGQPHPQDLSRASPSLLPSPSAPIANQFANNFNSYPMPMLPPMMPLPFPPSPYGYPPSPYISSAPTLPSPNAYPSINSHMSSMSGVKPISGPSNGQ